MESFFYHLSESTVIFFNKPHQQAVNLMFHIILHVAKEPWLFLEVQSMVHVSSVTCHVSRVTCHVSPVTFYPSKIGQSGGACRWRVCYEWVLPCLVFKGILFRGQMRELQSHLLVPSCTGLVKVRTMQSTVD